VPPLDGSVPVPSVVGLTTGGRSCCSSALGSRVRGTWVSVKRFAALMSLVFIAALPATASTVTRSDHANARKVVLAYSAALERRDWSAVCHYLTRGARKELVKTARERNLGSRRCTTAARRVLDARLGDVTITKVTERDPVRVMVRFTVKPNNPGEYQADADAYTSVWHVYNVYMKPPPD
jgi:hypothetical protein